MKYITLFETTEAYNAATLDLPNVSLIEETMSVNFNPYVPETRVICKYNVTSTYSPTVLRTNESNIFKSMEIDGVMLDELVTEYTFDTVGVHTVLFTLVDGATSIGSSTFAYCSKLINITIPDSVTSIGNEVFYNCSGLTNITIPDSITSIGESAFSSCSGLTSITIPDSVTSIGESAFYNCGTLTSITIPDSVISISKHAFYSCSGLTSVIIGNSVTSIGDGAFVGCSGLTRVTIPDSVTSIGSAVFSTCSGLTNVIIGNSITDIGDYTFYNCSGLTNIICNATTAPSIGSSTFKGIKSGGTLTVPAGYTGYDVWMSTDDYYLGKYNWTKVEQ